MDKQTLAKVIRESGMIERCHTVPHHGTYKNSEHCFNALSLLFVLYPGVPSPDLIRAMLWHDVAERWTGDLPGPMKYVSRVLADYVEEVEERCLDNTGIKFFPKLTEDEQTWLKAIDKIELWLWSADQIAMGNENAIEIQRTLYDLFMDGAIKLPKECVKFVRNFRWSRLSDSPPVER